jgi:hypothetical protein
MATEDLFIYSRAFDNAPVYRNINRRPEESAFDDLLDESNSDAAELALRKANQVRFNTNPFMGPPSGTHYGLAIQNVFQRSVFYPTRYGDGSFPVWYGCMDQLTTMHETAYHMMKEENDLGPHSEPIVRQRLVYKVFCTAILIDLTRTEKKAARLIDAGNYSFTQQIGKRIRTEGHPGLLAPSARHRGGVNFAIFTPRALSSPELVGCFSYQFDPSLTQVTIRENDGGQSRPLCIEGRQWLPF